jgi:Flp pilus assembly protein TadD
LGSAPTTNRLAVAVHRYEQALSLNPRGAFTLSSLGYTYHLQVSSLLYSQLGLRRVGSFDASFTLLRAFTLTAHTHRRLQGRSELAVEYYHKALGLKPDDSFTHELLNVAMQEHTAWFAHSCGAS